VIPVTPVTLVARLLVNRTGAAVDHTALLQDLVSARRRLLDVGAPVVMGEEFAGARAGRARLDSERDARMANLVSFEETFLDIDEARETLRISLGILGRRGIVRVDGDRITVDPRTSLLRTAPASITFRPPRAALAPGGLILASPLAILLALLAAASPRDPLPGDPRPSCSSGTRSSGTLLHGSRLPDTGCGYRRIFPHRPQAFGSDELVRGILRVARLLDRQGFTHDLPGGVHPSMGVGNLGPPAGREMEEDPYLGKRFSMSHGSGRAVDIAFFIVDRSGHSVSPNETAIGFRMDGWNTSGWRRIYLRGDAEPTLPERCRKGKRYDGISEWKCFVPARAYRLDDERNWALVRALLLDPDIGVIDPRTGRVRPRDRGIRRILVSSGIQRAACGRRADRETAALRGPRRGGDAARQRAAHDDHLHVDLNCDMGDIRDAGAATPGSRRALRGRGAAGPASAPAGVRWIRQYARIWLGDARENSSETWPRNSTRTLSAAGPARSALVGMTTLSKLDQIETSRAPGGNARARRPRRAQIGERQARSWRTRGLLENPAIPVPWKGAPRATQVPKSRSPPPRTSVWKITRAPSEWPTASIRSAPVSARISSTRSITWSESVEMWPRRKSRSSRCTLGNPPEQPPQQVERPPLTYIRTRAQDGRAVRARIRGATPRPHRAPDLAQEEAHRVEEEHEDAGGDFEEDRGDRAQPDDPPRARLVEVREAALRRFVGEDDVGGRHVRGARHDDRGEYGGDPDRAVMLSRGAEYASRGRPQNLRRAPRSSPRAAARIEVGAELGGRRARQSPPPLDVGEVAQVRRTVLGDVQWTW
jgi:murein endopeptidase